MKRPALFNFILFSVLAFLIAGFSVSSKPLPTELFLRGYSVIPAPRKVQLQGEEIEFNGSWTYASSAVASNHIAIRTLLQDLKDFHSVELKPGAGRNVVRLSVRPGAAKTEADPEIDRQGYVLKIFPGSIDVTGNSDVGLLYGVQTLLQLLKP